MILLSKIHVCVSDTGKNEWESPDGKRYDFWEFFVCWIFVKHKSQEGKKKNGKVSDFNWTDDEIQLLPEICFDFKAESEYEGE